MPGGDVIYTLPFSKVSFVMYTMTYHEVHELLG